MSDGLPATLLSRLSAIVGPGRLVTDRDDLFP